VAYNRFQTGSFISQLGHKAIKNRPYLSPNETLQIFSGRGFAYFLYMIFMLLIIDIIGFYLTKTTHLTEIDVTARYLAGLSNKGLKAHYQDLDLAGKNQNSCIVTGAFASPI